MDFTFDELLTIEHILEDVQENTTDYIDDMQMYLTEDNFMLMLSAKEVENIKSILSKLQNTEQEYNVINTNGLVLATCKTKEEAENKANYYRMIYKSDISNDVHIEPIRKFNH